MVSRHFSERTWKHTSTIMKKKERNEESPKLTTEQRSEVSTPNLFIYFIARYLRRDNEYKSIRSDFSSSDANCIFLLKTSQPRNRLTTFYC